MSELPRDPDQPVDLGDERDVRQLARTAKGRENIRAVVLRNIMSSVDGREWMRELLYVHCHIQHTSWSSDPLRMAANEGERNVGLKIEVEVRNACPEHYLQMMKEVKDRADV